MTHKDPLLAAARGQPQTQGNKDARHGAYAGATTTAETHEPDAQQTKPTDASAPKPEADAKEAGAAGVPESKADPAAAPAPAPSPALTTPLDVVPAEMFGHTYSSRHAGRDTQDNLGPGMVPGADASRGEAFFRGKAEA